MSVLFGLLALAMMGTSVALGLMWLFVRIVEGAQALGRLVQRVVRS